MLYCYYYCIYAVILKPHFCVFAPDDDPKHMAGNIRYFINISIVFITEVSCVDYRCDFISLLKKAFKFMRRTFNGPNTFF
jgi:hypothetical protein